MSRLGGGVSKQSVRRRELRAALFAKQNGRCHWCGHHMSLKVRNPQRCDFATFEHLIPQHAGGKMEDNVVLSHDWCNNARADKIGPPPHVSDVARETA